MKLIRLHVENFGTLKDYRMEFSKGLNVLHRENGWGKSTLAVFIKAMLYGLPATRTKALDENERAKYTPWQGGAFGGSLEFETARGRFRIERFFGDKESGDEVTVYDLSTNRPTSVYSDPIGEALFGIDADGFERTVYLSQRSLKSGDNVSITEKLNGLLDAVDDLGNYEDAYNALDKRRQYYVKKGERGRIAELEQRHHDAQRELEKLLDVQKSLIEKEDLYDFKMETQRACEGELKDVRRDLGRASLLREREAHLERKNAMLGELAQLEQTRRNAEAALGGRHPTDGELEQVRTDLEALRNAKARRDAISAEPVQRETLRILPAQMAESVPDVDLIARMKEQNHELEELFMREEAQSSVQGNPAWRRFASGAPSDAEMNSVYSTLNAAKDAKQESERIKSAPVQKHAPTLAIVLLCLGAVLAVVSALFLPMGLIGAALCIIGAVIGFVSRSGKQKRILAERDAAADAKAKEAQEHLLTVKRFLARYGANGYDPERELYELGADLRGYRSAKLEWESAAEQRQTRAAEKQRIYDFLLPTLRLFGIVAEKKRSYRRELEDLEEDVRMLLRVKNEEADRQRKRALADAEYRDCQSRIKPFLDRFDPDRKMSSAVECLEKVGAWETDFCNASRDYRAKHQALLDFIREKKLDEAVDYEGLDYDALSARQTELQGKCDDLKNETATLKSDIDNLARDADRLDAVQSEVARLKEEAEIAKANSKTVQSTMEFLKKAKTALSTRYLGGMEKSFARFLAALTSDESPELMMDDKFGVKLCENGKMREMASFSRGWRDAVQFCTRLSLADALYAEGEKPFLLLDDPFVNLDDRRLSAARRMLDLLAGDYQIVYMVCHADRG